MVTSPFSKGEFREHEAAGGGTLDKHPAPNGASLAEESSATGTIGQTTEPTDLPGDEPETADELPSRELLPASQPGDYLSQLQSVLQQQREVLQQLQDLLSSQSHPLDKTASKIILSLQATDRAIELAARGIYWARTGTSGALPARLSPEWQEYRHQATAALRLVSLLDV